MDIKLIDLKRQYDLIKKDIFEDFEHIFNNCSFIMGENVKKFEDEFAKYLNVKHAISVGNGTDALVIALQSLGIKENDEVITTSYTFFATAESIAKVGAIPVFVDVYKDTYNMNIEEIEKKITNKTKAIMPVHIFGLPCDINEVCRIAKKHNLYVIEDACQAAGSSVDGKMIGSFGDISCFSFFPTKNLGCAGDGGMIVTNNDDLATIARAYRTHGSGKDGGQAYELLTGNKVQVENYDGSDNTVYNPLKYYNYIIGCNSRLDEIQACILRRRLPYLDKYNEDRIKTAKFYTEKLKNTSLIAPIANEGYKHIYHLYILQSDKREKLLEYLKTKNIAAGIYYQVPMHLQKALLKYGYKKGDCPVSELLSNRTFAIPLYPLMTEEEKNYVVNALISFEEGNNE